jgi:hypothetical protein
MLIDKINMYYKSSKKLNIKFSKEEQTWVNKIDNIKTFSDVLKIAKELYGWQEKQLEQLAKLPDFDNHPLSKNYKLDKNGKSTIQITVNTESNNNSSNSNIQKKNYRKTKYVLTKLNKHTSVCVILRLFLLRSGLEHP